MIEKGGISVKRAYKLFLELELIEYLISTRKLRDVRCLLVGVFRVLGMFFRFAGNEILFATWFLFIIFEQAVSSSLHSTSWLEMWTERSS